MDNRNEARREPFTFVQWSYRLLPVVISIFIGFEVWQEREMRRISDNQRSVLQWKEDVPERMDAEKEQLRLEITQSIVTPITVQLNHIQQSIIKSDAKVEYLEKSIITLTAAVKDAYKQ